MNDQIIWWLEKYLVDEIRLFKPNCVLALGEHAHRLFITIFDNENGIPDNMKDAFIGNFLRQRLTKHLLSIRHVCIFKLGENQKHIVIGSVSLK